MNWRNLLKNRCPSPKCEEPLTGGLLDPVKMCSGEECTFSITVTKFDTIVKDMLRPKWKPQDEYENRLSELNNLGREKVEEDFSDSPYYKNG